MNDLLGPLDYQALPSEEQDIETGPPPPLENPGLDVDRFAAAASEVSNLVKDAQVCLKTVREKQNESKRTESVEVYKSLSKSIWEQMSLLNKIAREVKSRTDALANDNAVNLTYPDCGPGSSIERARTNITVELKDRLQDLVIDFSDQKEDLEDDLHSEFHPEVAKHLQEIEEQRLQAVAENPNEFLDFAGHMLKRDESVKQLNSNLKGLMQMFSDMVVVVDAQGKELDSIETQVQVTAQNTDQGHQELKKAKKYNDRSVVIKIALFVMGLIVFIILLIWLSPYISLLFG